MAREKATVTLDRRKVEEARALTGEKSTSAIIDLALDRLVRAERLRRVVRVPASRSDGGRRGGGLDAPRVGNGRGRRHPRGAERRNRHCVHGARIPGAMMAATDAPETGALKGTSMVPRKGLEPLQGCPH